MLTRIYGTAFATKEELESYLAAVEEAKKRDHNKLGRQLGLFTTSEEIGQGLPIILPKGTVVLRTLQRWVEDEEEKRGYQQTKTPFMAKARTVQALADIGTTTGTECSLWATAPSRTTRKRRFLPCVR